MKIARRKAHTAERPIDAATIIALIVAGILILVTVLAPWIAPQAPDAIDLAGRRAPPSTAHWFGTDDLGRDLLARVLFGARVSLAIGVLAAVLTVALGAGVGTVAGWTGRWVDALLMRVADAILAVPRLPLLMIGSVILRPGVALLILLVAAVSWMETARVVRAEVRSLATRGFVEAARAVGAGALLSMWRHILPNVLPILVVATTLAVGRSILLESALSFFGVGVQPPTASWGNMLYQAQATMATEPWLALFPGVAILISVVTVNALGEGLDVRRSGQGG
ncbi:MAG TPA: ABC transporter permease [Gemmatimonadaceae bacterium]